MISTYEFKSIFLFLFYIRKTAILKDISIYKENLVIILKNNEIEMFDNIHVKKIETFEDISIIKFTFDNIPYYLYINKNIDTTEIEL